MLIDYISSQRLISSKMILLCVRTDRLPTHTRSLFQVQNLDNIGLNGRIIMNHVSVRIKKYNSFGIPVLKSMLAFDRGENCKTLQDCH